MRIHAPQTIEGLQVWDLMLRCGRQLRTAGMDGRPLGYDMSAVFTMAEALGVNRTAVAEFFPMIEHVAMTEFQTAAQPAQDQEA